jgi:hypothetical protein
LVNTGAKAGAAPVVALHIGDPEAVIPTIHRP